MTSLRKSLLEQFGEDVSKKAIAEITGAIADLGKFPEKGIDISKMYGIETA